MHRIWRRPPCGSSAWSLDRNQRTRPNTTPPPRGSSTWGDAQIGRATIEYPPHSDGSYRANGVGWHARRLRDGCGFRFITPPSDHHLTGINPVVMGRARSDRVQVAIAVRWGQALSQRKAGRNNDRRWDLGLVRLSAVMRRRSAVAS